MTKTFRDNCDINIVEQTSCEPLFPDVQMQLKMYFFISFVRPCIHHNYGGISGSHACKDCVWPIILDADLYTTCPGERVLVADMITNRFAGWISGRIVSLQPDTDIQKLLSNGNRIRISKVLLSMFRGFTLLEKVAHCTINHSTSSEASFQPSVPWVQVCLWCNLCTVM